jgi:hypothetical protein
MCSDDSLNEINEPFLGVFAPADYRVLGLSVFTVSGFNTLPLIHNLFRYLDLK